MNFRAKLLLVIGAFSGALSVVLAAVIAHAVSSQPALQSMLGNALGQHQFQSVGVLLAGLMLIRAPFSRLLWAAGWLLLTGIVLFSFNLYARGLFGMDALRALAPWGGSSAIAGWLCLAIGVARMRATG